MRRLICTLVVRMAKTGFLTTWLIWLLVIFLVYSTYRSIFFLFFTKVTTVSSLNFELWIHLRYRYCAVSNQWTIITKIRTPRSECACAVVREKIYVIGGYNWNARKRLSDVERFDTDTGSWTSLQDIDQPLTGVGAVGITIYHQNRVSDKTVVSKDVKISDNPSWYTKMRLFTRK